MKTHYPPVRRRKEQTVSGDATHIFLLAMQSTWLGGESKALSDRPNQPVTSTDSVEGMKGDIQKSHGIQQARLIVANCTK